MTPNSCIWLFLQANDHIRHYFQKVPPNSDLYADVLQLKTEVQNLKRQLKEEKDRYSEELRSLRLQLVSEAPPIEDTAFQTTESSRSSSTGNAATIVLEIVAAERDKAGLFAWYTHESSFSCI